MYVFNVLSPNLTVIFVRLWNMKSAHSAGGNGGSGRKEGRGERESR